MTDLRKDESGTGDSNSLRSTHMRAWRVEVTAAERWEMIVSARSKSAASRKAIASVREMEGLENLTLKARVVTEGP